MNQALICVFIGLVAGIFGGLFGIGGAVVIIPLLLFFFGFDQHLAQGTTLMAMVPPIGLLAALKYYREGNVKLALAMFIALGFFVGGFIGATLAHKIEPTLMRRMFGGLMLVIAVRMIFGK